MILVRVNGTAGKSIRSLSIREKLKLGDNRHTIHKVWGIPVRIYIIMRDMSSSRSGHLYSNALFLLKVQSNRATFKNLRAKP